MLGGGPARPAADLLDPAFDASTAQHPVQEGARPRLGLWGWLRTHRKKSAQKWDLAEPAEATKVEETDG